MTDIEKFTNMLSDFHITGYETDRDDDGITSVTLAEGCCESVGGYMGFLSVWTFNVNGSFIKTASWE